MPSLPKHLPFFIITAASSYYAELETEGKTKKLQNLTKIDFPLIVDGKILEDKLEEALEKLGQKSLYFILSDDIFLHHIGEFPLKAPQPLEEQISHTVATAFPNQTESLHIVTLSLAKTSKTQTIQITAMTRANLHTLSRACLKVGVSAKQMMPASFAVKGFVSIDPSLFILETEENVWLTSHYIGIEHAETVSGLDADKVAEAVTQLKNQKPHLQHVYVCVNTSEAEKFTTALKDVLPSQLIEVKGIEADADCPLMIKVLTVGFKDVVENKFPFPSFTLEDKPDSAEKSDVTPAVTPVEAVAPVKEKEDTPTQPAVAKVASPAPTPSVTTPTSIASVSAPAISKPIGTVTTPAATHIIAPKTSTPPGIVPPTTLTDKPGVTMPPAATSVVTPVNKPAPAKKAFGKYILLAGGVALIIGLIGGGIIVSQQALSTQPSSYVEPSPAQGTPEPAQEVSPSPSPTPASSPIAKDKVSVLILNATGVAGKAGKTADSFKTAGYTKVQTGNAKEEYDKGTFIMIEDEKNTGLAEQVTKDTKLTLKKLEYTNKEDSKGTYDVIVVLAE